MDKFSNLPTSVKGGLAAGGAGGMLATGLLVGSGKWIFLIVLVVLLVVLAGGYLLWVSLKRKKMNARLGGELKQHSSASPQGISDPGQRARLDDLRKKFEQGVAEYRSRGKDLYTLPWYVIVGEPGSGKTEAVRHSNVGFPPGMQDEFQGVGGTINMNWWFTNQAVLLDTAGRLMFEEVAPGGTSEWKEFLNLLKKNRPTCPINGLFLVIPSDSLIKNSADEIAQKAGKIARQLDVIQRTLDVRFPVFVVVTKCDKINGFREFFDGLTDPQLQHQIMGWTNPDSLDLPFRPELVDQHLESVSGRLRKRRMGLLRDPVPETAPRRADEVDSLYALPHSLSLLAPRLRRYLETIFVAGEWSAKPLFLRGIFFTSSMREGAALDEELASAIGVQVDELPEGKIWERERAYFLRDLFLEKVFREKGLVTRATNTGKMLRRRQVAFLGTIAAGLLLFTGIAWFGMHMLKSNVKEQSDFWHAVSSAGWSSGGVWDQSIIPLQENGLYAGYATNEVWLPGRVEPYALGDFYAELQAESAKNLKRNWLFPGLASTYNANKLKAQRVIFETGVLRPVVEAARQKAQRQELDNAASQGFLKPAVAALIELEGSILARNNPAEETAATPLSAAKAESVLKSLIYFAASEQADVPPALITNMVYTYTSGLEDMDPWPPSWASERVGASTNAADPAMMASYPALSAALEKSLALSQQRLGGTFGAWKEIETFKGLLNEFREVEMVLAKTVPTSPAVSQFERDAYLQQLERLHGVITRLDEQGARVKETPFFEGSGSLSNALSRLEVMVRESITNELATVRAANGNALRKSGHPLFENIQAKLDDFEARQLAVVSQFQTASDPAFDAYFFTNPNYEQRAAIYKKAHEILTAKPFAEETLLGDKGDAYQQYLGRSVTSLRSEAAGYPAHPALGAITEFALRTAETIHRRGYIEAYVTEARREIYAQAGFPLIKGSDTFMDLPSLNALERTLIKVRQDLASPAFQNPDVENDPAWTQAKAKLGGILNLYDVLRDRNRNPIKCEVFLRKYEESLSATQDKWRDTFRGIRLNDSSTPENTNKAEDALLGAGGVSVEKAFALHIIDDPNKPLGEQTVETFRTEDWGPLWLLHEYNAEPSADGREWTVAWPIRVTGVTADGQIRLLLRFEKPLPKLSEWPTMPN